MPAPNLGDIGEQLRRSTVQVLLPSRGGGSGVITSSLGLIVTNAHVVRGRHPTVELWDGRRFPARLLALARRHDLALLKIETLGLPAAALGDSSALRPGEIAIAAGNPLGFTGALSTGVIHTVGPLQGLGPNNWVQAAVRLAPGNSGGPLADARGHVIGINTMIAAGLALAIPSNVVRDFLRLSKREAA
ncbi:MAG: trypsin-like peptidase domain-containing protein [Bryobacterales bacterium]|nr:trypsin-like peptidase domain-containing protein [Bryobacterales bacterium]